MSAERVTPEQCRENAAIADDAGHRKMGAFLRDIADTIEALERDLAMERLARKQDAAGYESELREAKERIAELERMKAFASCRHLYRMEGRCTQCGYREWERK